MNSSCNLCVLRVFVVKKTATKHWTEFAEVAQWIQKMRHQELRQIRSSELIVQPVSVQSMCRWQ